MAEKNITRRINIYINGKEVKNTVTDIKKAIAKAQAQANKEIPGSEEWKKYTKEVFVLKEALNDAKEEQKAFTESLSDTTTETKESENALKAFNASFSQLTNGIKSGNLMDIAEGWKGVKSGIKGAVKASWSFIATPIGAAIAVLMGIGLAAKEWLEYNVAVQKSIETTQQMTSLVGSKANEARIRAESLAEAFGGDFTDKLKEAKSLVRQFGIGYDEAFDIIERKLVEGQDKNEEFGESIEEYGTFFNSAGFSATEFANIIQKGYDLDFYKDKLPDAIKEADLALKEQTKSTRDALLNAFGASFTDDVLKRVRTGKTTTKEALIEIGEEAEKQNLNQQQYAQLTADIFKGAGEDAGGAATIFETLTDAIDGTNRELTEAEQITQDHIKANAELKRVTTALFFANDKGWGLIKDKARLFLTQGLLKILTAGVDAYNWVVDMNNKFTGFSATLVGVKNVTSVLFDFMIDKLMFVVRLIGSFGTILEGVLSRDWDQVKEGFGQFGEAFTKPFTNGFDNIKKGIEEVKNAASGEVKLERFDLHRFSETDDTKTKDKEKDITDDNKLILKDAKELESRKKLIEELKKLEDEREIQDALRKVEEAEREELEAILRAELKYERLIEQANGELELIKQLESLKQSELQVIEEKFRAKREKADEKERIKKAKADEKARKLELKRKEQFNKKMFDAGLQLFGAESKIGKIILATKQIFATKEMLIQLGLLKSKAAAGVAESKINTAVGHSATAKVGFPQNIPLIAAFVAQTAGIIGTIISAGKADKVVAPSFFYGGATGSTGLGFGDKYGEFAGYVHKDEYTIPSIVRQEPIVAHVLEPLIEETRFQTTGKGQGAQGAIEEVTENTNSTNSISDNNIMAQVSNFLEILVTRGVSTNIGNRQIKEFTEQQDKLSNGRNRAKINS